MARGHLARLAGSGALALPLVAATGCTTPTSFNPASSEGSAISDVFTLVMVLSALVLLGVAAALVYVLIRYRGRPGEPDPPQIAGNRKLEVGWTAGAVLLLVVIATASFPVLHVVDSTPASPVRVSVIGHQWWWEYRYPDLGVVTAGEPHLPLDTQLRVEVTGADVIHSFWVPQFGRMIDAIPGRTNVMPLRLHTPGVYQGFCAQYCGTQHAWMLIRATAESREQFDAWVQQQRQPAATPQAATAIRGQQVFLQNTCVSCHTVRGTTANGAVGPDLTHVGSRATLGSGVVENNVQNMRRWVTDAQSIKPGVLMPRFSLSEQDASALAEYLEGLK